MTGERAATGNNNLHVALLPHLIPSSIFLCIYELSLFGTSGIVLDGHLE
jgi:hypothetical protein